MSDDEIYSLAVRAAILTAKKTGRPGDWEDYRQEILLVIYRSMRFYDPSKGSEGAWINSVAHNTVCNITRRENSEFRRAMWFHDPL